MKRTLSAALTVIFLGFIFLALGMTLIHSGPDILKSLQMTEAMKATLPEHPSRLDRLAARIDGFTSGIADAMWLKTEMGYANSAFQYALGKRMINTGSQNMLMLTTGHLYDVSPYRDLKPGAAAIVALREEALSDVPFLFVYEHPTLYDPAMMPEGYEALDHAGEMADEAVSTLREGGIQVLDSRDVLTHCPYDLGDLLMVTDQHWSTLAAITMGQAIAEKLNDLTGAGLNPSLMDLENLNTLTHEKLFMGKYGQRVGTAFVTPDDIVEYWPKDEPVVHSIFRRNDEDVEKTAPFREAVTRADRLLPDPGKTWNTLAYTYYGQVEAYSIFENEQAPDYTILLLKDSYSAPIGTFMSLLARRVVCVDLRKASKPLKAWVEEYQPDAVVMAYSLQMLRDDNYEFE